MWVIFFFLIFNFPERLVFSVYHWAEVKAKMYLMNLRKPTKVSKLNEQMAIELGASLMGEVIIFSVAGGCLLFEYNRQVTKETKKEEVRLQQLEKFTNDIQALYETAVKQEAEIDYLMKSVEELAKKAKHKLPEKPIIVTTNYNNISNNNKAIQEKDQISNNKVQEQDKKKT